MPYAICIAAGRATLHVVRSTYSTYSYRNFQYCCVYSWSRDPIAIDAIQQASSVSCYFSPVASGPCCFGLNSSAGSAPPVLLLLHLLRSDAAFICARSVAASSCVPACAAILRCPD